MSRGLHSYIHNHNEKLDKFKILHKKKYVRAIDRWAMVIGVLAPLASLPQVFQIIETKNADGVSVLTWVLYMLLSILWIIYGIAHKERVIVVTNILWLILELFIVVLSLMY